MRHCLLPACITASWGPPSPCLMWGLPHITHHTPHITCIRSATKQDAQHQHQHGTGAGAHLWPWPMEVRYALEELPSQMWTFLACSSRASVLPLMNHSSSSATPVQGTCRDQARWILDPEPERGSMTVCHSAARLHRNLQAVHVWLLGWAGVEHWYAISGAVSGAAKVWQPDLMALGDGTVRLSGTQPRKNTFLVVSRGKECRRSKRRLRPKTESVPVPVRSGRCTPEAMTSRTTSRYCTAATAASGWSRPAGSTLQQCGRQGATAARVPHRPATYGVQHDQAQHHAV